MASRQQLSLPGEPDLVYRPEAGDLHELGDGSCVCAPVCDHVKACVCLYLHCKLSLCIFKYGLRIPI